MFHFLTDILRNSILITGLVAVMMMMIESLNIESEGMFFRGLRKTKIGQVVIAALLGSVPGCMGGFATVSLYTHRMFSFGALVAMMIASSGDEAFMMLAMIPDKALAIFAILFVIAVIAGILTDFVYGRLMGKDHAIPAAAACSADLHDEDREELREHKPAERHFGRKRITMFVGLAIFIAALAGGMLSHDHSHHYPESTECHETEHLSHGGEGFSIDLLSEDWMNVLFAGLSVIVLFVLALGSDHFVEEHLWNHIVRKHIPVIFAWTFGVLLILGIVLRYLDISAWISGNTVLMILLATAVGLIPESGPHMIFVTLYAAGVVPMPVLLASCISQDGHASLPLLAESKKSFLWAKLINCAVALVAGFTALAFSSFPSGNISIAGANAAREVRILSYNVHACSPKGSEIANYDALAELISESGADIVSLQELDCRNQRHAEDQIQELASRCGMEGHFTRTIDFAGGEYGIGMLFRERPLAIQELQLPGKEPRCLLCVEFGNAIYIATHLCLFTENQIASMNIINDYADSLTDRGKPIFIAGDFNAEIDSCAFSGLFHSDWIVISGDDPTFPSDAPQSRIDYIMMHRDSAAAGVHVAGNGIYRSRQEGFDVLSDHLPIYADVTLTPDK